jgi:hypothetical protein
VAARAAKAILNIVESFIEELLYNQKIMLQYYGNLLVVKIYVQCLRDVEAERSKKLPPKFSTSQNPENAGNLVEMAERRVVSDSAASSVSDRTFHRHCDHELADMMMVRYAVYIKEYSANVRLKLNVV